MLSDTSKTRFSRGVTYRLPTIPIWNIEPYWSTVISLLLGYHVNIQADLGRGRTPCIVLWCGSPCDVDLDRRKHLFGSVREDKVDCHQRQLSEARGERRAALGGHLEKEEVR